MEPDNAPLGFVHPDGSLHGVVLSLPTLGDVIGYETGDARVVAALTHAYPRFWRHSLVQALVERCRQAAAERGATDAVYSVAVHAAAARQAVGYAGAGSVASVAELLLGAAAAASTAATAPALAGLHAILVPPGDKAAAGRVKDFLQHTGAQVGSRQAQDALAQLAALQGSGGDSGSNGTEKGADDAPTAAATAAAAVTVRAALRTALSARPACLPRSAPLPQLADDDVILTNSGMAAFTAVYGAVRALWARREAADAARGHACSNGAGATGGDAPAQANLHRRRQRYLWLQLGWLYLDTSEVMKKLGAPATAGAGCCAADASCLCCGSDGGAVADAAALAAVAARHPPGTLDYDTRRGVVRVFDMGGDLGALADVLAAVGPSLAALVTECPTNPLLQCADLTRVAGLVAAHSGCVLVVDPTMAGLGNVGVLPLGADVVPLSTTKYAAHGGDVLSGAVALNPASAFYGELRACLAGAADAALVDASTTKQSASAPPVLLLSPYARDVAALAREIVTTPAVVAQMNANCAAVVAWLRGHTREGGGSGAVRAVHWAYSGRQAEAYARIVAAADDDDDTGNAPAAAMKPGCMVTFELGGTWPSADGATANDHDDTPHADVAARVLAAFYDATPLAKGPSFGTTFSILCPFLYLAHFDLVSAPAGRAGLRARGLNPFLLRLSVGCEPAGDILAALQRGLDAAAAAATPTKLD